VRGDKLSEMSSVWARLLKEEPSPAAKRAVEPRLARFGKTKDVLIECLRSAAGVWWLPGVPRPVKKRLDEEGAWRRLFTLATVYFFWRATASSATRDARLRKLAEALGRVQVLVEKARQDNVGTDLIGQFIDGVLPREPRGRFVLDNDGTLRAEFFPEIDFREIAASLHAYKAAVERSVRDVAPRQPGPVAALPPAYIAALADAYLDFTGKNPGAGQGPFYRFVMQFRAALDPTYKLKDESGEERIDESMLEAIKKALRVWKRTRGHSSK
jgi:hypothetical protein